MQSITGYIVERFVTFHVAYPAPNHDGELHFPTTLGPFLGMTKSSFGPTSDVEDVKKITRSFGISMPLSMA
jgi:hypothetical protein